jgi:DNA invertase Pin-like site-specific DNA recombinase
VISSLEVCSSKVTAAHRAKVAYVYIRQSSLGQVTRHAESTELRYELVERAVALGWPRERVAVIDDDLGKSGASAATRLGFQHLIAEISLARVGLVISMDASRLARNNGDWYRLLELCSMFGTLIADCEQLYDPQVYHDRLLLGLSGMMSEAELHHLKLRLQAGARHKAERGQLRQPLPAGLQRLRGGEVVLNPDEEVQARLRLVFRQFEQLGNTQSVVQYLRRHDLQLPVRLRRGPEPQEVVWRQASRGRVLQLLHNPAYAGAFVFGRRTRCATRRKPDQPRSGTVMVPVDKWGICLQDVYPSYISWEEFLAHQTRLRNNQNRYRTGRLGVPRSGRALLQGIILCGRCGRRLRLRYAGRQKEYAAYVCDADRDEFGGSVACQRVPIDVLDAEVERLMLAALLPERVEMALAALAEMEQEAAALDRQWELRRERARYEAERARRQYHEVEPENRLVARSLEGQWEQRLRAVEEVEHAYRRWSSRQQLVITEEDRRDILRLGEDLPRVWGAASTTQAERKQLLRLVVKEVVIDSKRREGWVWFQVNWQTGAVSEHWVERPVHSYAEHAHYEELRQLVDEQSRARKLDEEIAAALNAGGLRTAHGRRFTRDHVWNLRRLWGIAAQEESGAGKNPPRWADGTYSAQGVAAVGVRVKRVRGWLERGHLKGEQIGRRMPWKIRLTEEEIAALKAYVVGGNRPQEEAL